MGNGGCAASKVTFQMWCGERFKWMVGDLLSWCSCRIMNFEVMSNIVKEKLKFELLGIRQSFLSAKKLRSGYDYIESCQRCHGD